MMATFQGTQGLSPQELVEFYGRRASVLEQEICRMAELRLALREVGVSIDNMTVGDAVHALQTLLSLADLRISESADRWVQLKDAGLIS